MTTEKLDAKAPQKKNIVSFISADDIDIKAPIKKASTKSFSTCVRVYLQNVRQGTVGSKGRSDIAYTNKKPWKQKGTGRARAGSARSPLWRGGGVVFGPQARIKMLKVPKKIKQKVMYTLLSDLLDKKLIGCADWQLQGDVPKTAQAYKMLKDAKMVGKRVAFFISSDDLLTRASFMNIDCINVYFFDQPNVYDMARSDYWLFLKRDQDRFKEMVAQWT